MTTNGIRVFDETITAANTWLHELSSRMGWDDRQKSYRLLRLTLHALRDRMPVPEAAHFSAQLPLLLRGVFFEGWRPAAVPTRARSVDDLLAGIRKAFSNEPDFDAEAAFREVLDVMKMHVTEGEMEDVRRVMPDELKGLWQDDVWQAR